MTTLTVLEASQNLSGWLERALHGEEIGIVTGGSVVTLKPAVALEPVAKPGRLSPREALRALQQEACLSAAQADEYLREVQAERLAMEGH